MVIVHVGDNTNMKQPAPYGGRLFALLATNAYVINLLL